MGITRQLPCSTVVMIIYHYVERIWRIIVTPNYKYKIYDNEKILSRRTSLYTYKIINKYFPEEKLDNYHQKRVMVNYNYFVVVDNR